MIAKNIKYFLVLIIFISICVFSFLYFWQEKIAEQDNVIDAPKKENQNQEFSLPKNNLIKIDNLKAGDVLKSPAKITGEARGYWFFEASFPVYLLDGNGQELKVAIATAQSDWMTENFVPFEVVLEFDAPIARNGLVIFKKDNPSGLSEHDDSLVVPIVFDLGDDDGDVNAGECRATGCSGQICSSEDVITTCEYSSIYACYGKAKCEMQKENICGWTLTNEFISCLNSVK